MKKAILLLLMALVVVSCSKDESTLTENQENLVHELDTDLRKQKPNRAYDNDVRGTYAGVIVANSAKFHGKLWLNIGNDGNTNAFVETVEGEELAFELAASSGSINTNYTFVNNRGSFEVNLSDFTNVVISNISIDETNGDAFVAKEINGNNRTVNLGTYDNSIAGLTTGTWDIMTPGAGGYENIDAIMVTGAGGGMQVELAADLEGQTPACYGGGPYPPFFWQDPLDNKFELYATGQSFTTYADGSTVLYDFGWSKYLCNLYGLAYTQGLYYPEATADVLFGGLAPGCYNINDYGYYAWMEADGVTLRSSGRITFSLPDFAALGYTANCTNGIMDGNEEGVDCGGFCPACVDPLSDETNRSIQTDLGNIQTITSIQLNK
ncbi:MAG: hypothetical protein ACI9SJ_001471 [Flavobacteriaceae bacterium]|jgi:hypothetical protein|uniref:hypothetical protein n=1 Tax=Candidatus Marifrigoribacter sp. Uisw_064 TaxID=3230970 RepID=UPI003ADB4B24